MPKDAECMMPNYSARFSSVHFVYIIYFSFSLISGVPTKAVWQAVGGRITSKWQVVAIVANTNKHAKYTTLSFGTKLFYYKVCIDVNLCFSFSETSTRILWNVGGQIKLWKFGGRIKLWKFGGQIKSKWYVLVALSPGPLSIQLERCKRKKEGLDMRWS